jgi:VIT1/CCC1 family predicted Fe2+/Mn2+ transporter
MLEEISMSRSIIIEIPEKEVASIEAALDEALAALRGMDDEESRARDERIMRLRAETHVLMEQTRKELHVEKTV